MPTEEPLPLSLSTPALADALIVDPFYLAISVDFEHEMSQSKAVLD